MRDQTVVKTASDNCMVFIDDSRREVRVVYEPDGKPLFCATDLATCMGYGAPAKAVSRVETIKKYRRFVPWVSVHKRGRSEAICYDRGGVIQFLRHGVPSEEVEQWVLDELIPRAETIGAQRGYSYEEPEEEFFEDEQFPASVPKSVSSILDRLDSIILEAVMLKQELSRTT